MPGTSGTDWLPGAREGQITMADTWLAAIPARGATWGIPAVEMTILTSLATNGKTALAKVQNKGERTAVDVADCKTKMEDLKARLRGKSCPIPSGGGGRRSGFTLPGRAG